jgi:putative ABC transport system permease protein
MIKNYWKIAVRSLTKHKGFALINIASLSIGIIGCLIIGLFVWDEWQYDKGIPGGENIYRIYTEKNTDNGTTYMACTAPMYATFLKQQYPEVDTTARILMTSDRNLMEVDDNKNYEDKGWFVEPSFFQVFPLRFLKGDPATALAGPASVVISEDLAKRYFAASDPIGKIVRIDKSDMTVTGVLAKLPAHFHLDFSYLMPLAAAGIPNARMEKWTWSQFYTYVKLKPNANARPLQDKFQAYVKNTVYADQKTSAGMSIPFFQHLKDIHLQSSDFIYDNAVRGNETYVRALTIIALFVLFIACFNFINLATARSFRRAKEIGVRKVAGAARRQLILQFISETVLLAVLSTVIAVAITLFVVPVLNNFTGKSIRFNPVMQPLLGLSILAAAVIVGILAGIYPALILSGFQPIKVLKNFKIQGSNTGTSWLRQGLVVVQFTLSTLLIIATITVYRQTQYLNNKDLGFDKEQVLHFQLRDELGGANLETFKSELRRTPNVVAVTSGYGLPGDLFGGDAVKIPGKNDGKEFSANLFIGDHDYIKTLGMRIIAGRDFSRNMATDADEAFIINETAVKDFGFGTPEKAIGQRIDWDKWPPLADSTKPVKMGKVIGVVQDFHYKSLHEKVTASVIQIYQGQDLKVAVKIKSADVKNTIASINRVWNKFKPGYPMDYTFMDDAYGKMYRTEEKLADLLWIFAAMAIIVGCMGLFGLAAFSAEQRTKEIGIRKVLGARVITIIGLLAGNFLKLVLIASVIAIPVARWAMINWLKAFPYRVNIGWWVFGLATIAALIVALLTVSFHSIRAAKSNPVVSLRIE